MNRKKLPIWDAVRRLKIFRRPPSPTFYAEERIDPGVNYFVLRLEQLGAVPHFSCEGHPNSFYVMFEAPMTLAEKILACGYFTVELEGRNLWSLRINREITEVERKRLLRSAAQAWEDKLGPLDMCDAVTGSWADELRRQKEKQNAKLV